MISFERRVRTDFEQIQSLPHLTDTDRRQALRHLDFMSPQVVMSRVMTFHGYLVLTWEPGAKNDTFQLENVIGQGGRSRPTTAPLAGHIAVWRRNLAVCGTLVVRGLKRRPFRLHAPGNVVQFRDAPRTGPVKSKGYPVASVYLNRISTAVPEHEVNDAFLRFARGRLLDNPRRRAVFDRMALRSGIDRRFSTIRPCEDPDGDAVDEAGVFQRGCFPGTAARMDTFEARAPELAMQAIAGLDLGRDAARITHLVVASCTGLSAPGLDLELVARLGLNPSIERTMIGFMGCYAAINALKMARHVVRSEPSARVLVVNCELCTLHLKDTDDLETLLSFCLWGDGCSAALVSGEARGLRLDSFRALLAADSAALMSWRVRDDGFDMVLSGRVPAAVGALLQTHASDILGGASCEDIAHWAVHPGGRSVLDTVEQSLGLGPTALTPSREVLRENGNMSSATVMFVLERMLTMASSGERGCAMAFGPGLTAETMLFEAA